MSRTLLLLLLPLLACAVACDEREGGAAPDAWPEAAPGERLVVQVQGAGGLPLAGAWVVLSPSGRDAEADANGEAVLSRLEAGTYTLRVAAPGYQAHERAITLPASEAVSVSLDVALATASLSGRVTGPDDAPVAGAPVSVNGVAEAVTDADGRWAISELEAGLYDVQIHAPPGTDLVGVDRPGLELAQRGALVLDLRLPSHAGPTASYIGSTACLSCHEAQGGAWRAGGHSGGPSTPAALADSPIAAAFASGVPIPVGQGATAHLAVAEPGVWTVELEDEAGLRSGALRVEAVVGAGRHGRALVLNRNGAALLAPIAWDDDLNGPSDAARDGGFVPAWTEAWLSPAGALRVTPTQTPPADTSFALRCGGCHATGVRAAAVTGGWSLGTGQPDPVEYAVGCEACHGPGSLHRRQAGERQAHIFNQALLSVDQREASCARCHERVSPADHPFSTAPSWPATPAGALPPPWAPAIGVGAPNPWWWRTLDTSRAHADQLGELLSSAHRLGESAFHGRCADCHASHGSANVASLHVDPWDNRLCTSCHEREFPDEAAQASHAGHQNFETGAWATGSCIGCHMPRSARVIGADPLTGAGEARAHSVLPWTPYELMAEFDDAEASALPFGEVPVAGCIDCHRVRLSLGQEQGGGCACPQGDPTQRSTYSALKNSYDRMFGARP